ncbi:MFS transporter [Micromonospora sp. CPCC 205546]|uniref:MFS transporter n=1 Tax=Micromonospora sp. CPCC 205546 TaxID=3122397 RepID=UPI002FF43517
MSESIAGKLTLTDRYVGPRGPGRTIAVAGFVDMLGVGLHLSLLPLFLVTFAGVTPAQVGLVVSVSGAAAFLAPYLAGHISDRVGPLPVWRVAVALRMVGYGLFIFIDSVWSYGLLALILTPLDRATGNAQLSYLIAKFDPDARNVTMAAVRSCRNAGLSIGLLVSSVFIAVGSKQAYQAAFLVNALSFLLLLGALSRLPAVLPPGPDSPSGAPAEAPPATRSPWTDRRYLTLTLGDALMSVHTTVLFIVFPLWMAAQPHLPTELVGVLLALNSVATVLLQPLLSEHGVGLRNAARLIRLAGLSLVAAGALFWAASLTDARLIAIVLLVLAMLSLTLGENVHEVAVFEACHRLAPDAAMGRYLGVFNLGDAAQRVVGPYALTALLVASPAGWGAFIVLTGLGSAVVLRSIGEKR